MTQEQTLPQDQTKKVISNMPLEKLSVLIETYHTFVRNAIAHEERRLASKTLEKLQTHQSNILAKKMYNDQNNTKNHRHKRSNNDYTEEEKKEIMRLIESV